uniref:Cytochrome P450 704C1 n=1 Tax=Kalanchoe fedtschenkoi TaxID=63787 RepID=A0A7N0V0P7_KALFE
MATDLVYAVLVAALALAVLISTPVLLLAAKIYSGKSVGDPSRPPVKGTVFHMLLYFNNMYDRQTEIARACPTYRLLAPDESAIYTTDPRNIEHVLKTRFNKYTKGKPHVEVLTDLFGEGVFLADGEKWRHQRKLASFEFSTRVLRDFSCKVFRKCSAKLVRAVATSAESHQPFDLQNLLMRGTLDSIFKVGFGVDLNCLGERDAESTAFSVAFDELNALVYRRYVDPIWKIKRALNVGSESLIKKHMKVIDDFAYGVIKAKRQQMKSMRESGEKEDILSRFLVESEKDPENMTDRYLKDIVLNFLIAGKDSSAVTMSWFFYMLCKNPVVQEKILQEIRDATGVNDGEKPEAEDFVARINDSVLDKMHYLHATLSETLRLYPAVPLDGRCAEEDDTLPDGYKLTKGDGVYYIAYAMGRMTRVWGEDAEDFRPERWIENGTFQHQSPFKTVP